MKMPSILQLSGLVYPIMLTQQAGEISESKACELLGLDAETYREKKEEAISAILGLLESLPSPLILLLEATKERRD